MIVTTLYFFHYIYTVVAEVIWLNVFEFEYTLLIPYKSRVGLKYLKIKNCFYR